MRFMKCPNFRQTGETPRAFGYGRGMQPCKARVLVYSSTSYWMPLTNEMVRLLPSMVIVQLSPTLCACIGVQNGLGTPGGAFSYVRHKFAPSSFHVPFHSMPNDGAFSVKV